MGRKVYTCEHENCGRLNVRKHTDIKNGEKYITLEISLKFGSLDKMKTISSEKNIIWEYQERDLLPLWVSRPLECRRKAKRKNMTLLMSV